VIRKPIKNMYLRVTAGGMTVTCPLQLADSRVIAFINGQQHQIAEKQAQLKAAATAPVLHSPAELEALIHAFIHRWLGVIAPGRQVTVKIKEYTSKWGSCRRDTGALAFNSRLCRHDEAVIEYVVIHELCHLIHGDHSPAFWAAVSQYCPEYKQLRKKLQDL